jgi:hypothetical protein
MENKKYLELYYGETDFNFARIKKVLKVNFGTTQPSSYRKVWGI